MCNYDKSACCINHIQVGRLKMYNLEYIIKLFYTNHVCFFVIFITGENVSCPTRPVRHAGQVGNFDPSPRYL